jgi:hypothetical protein
MAIPRGLKAIITSTAPGKLVRSKFAHYRATNADGTVRGSPLRGITKRLNEVLYSNGEFPEGVFKGEWRGGAWKGSGGGIRRGKAIDSQVSKLAGASKQKRAASNKFKLTRMLFGILDQAGIEPLCGQRVVIDEGKRLGTAADVVGYRSSDRKIVLIELKSGYNGDRTAPALKGGKVCFFQVPNCKAKDTIVNRHFAQLAATLEMFVAERRTIMQLKDKHGVAGVEGIVVYVNDAKAEVYELPHWWLKRGKAIVCSLGN